MTVRLPRTASRRARFDSLEQEVFLNVWRTYDRLRMLEDELFGQFDLTPQQYNVLRLLRAEFPQAAPTLMLAARLVSRAPDSTRILDKLEERTASNSSISTASCQNRFTFSITSRMSVRKPGKCTGRSSTN